MKSFKFALIFFLFLLTQSIFCQSFQFRQTALITDDIRTQILSEYTFINDRLICILVDSSQNRHVISINTNTGEKTILVENAQTEESELIKSSAFVTYKNQTYFLFANHLWKSDGTKEGTEAISKLNFTKIYSTIYSGKMYFVTQHKDSSGLWCSDGTPAGTKFIKKFTDNTGIGNLAVFQNNLYYSNTYLDHIDLISFNAVDSSDTFIHSASKIPELGYAFGIVVDSAFNDKLYFTTHSYPGYMNGIYETTGKEGSSKKIVPGGFYNHLVKDSNIYVGTHMIFKSDNRYYQEVYKYNTITNKTDTILSLQQDGYDIKNLTFYNNRLFCIGPKQVIWATDNQNNRMDSLHGINHALSFKALNSHLFIYGDNGRKIFYLDTLNKVNEIKNSDQNINMESFQRFNNNVAFINNNDLYVIALQNAPHAGMELWKIESIITTNTETKDNIKKEVFYPNPTNSFLNITCDDLISISIYSSHGVLIKTFSGTDVKTMIDLSFLTAGYYQIETLNDKGLITKQKLLYFQ